MNKFISCDWGTTSLRLRIVENETLNVLAEVSSQQGIAATYAMWQKSSSGRILFYEDILLSGISELASKCEYQLSKIPIIISGMTSSGIGMIELDYRKLPVQTNGKDFLIHTVESSARFKHRMIIISGLKSDNDVMRGEETMIAGCDIENISEERLFILPGTHSKHIDVKGDMITGVKTFMTGELFDLLSTKSILSNSVVKENFAADFTNLHFETGVKDGADNNLLNSIFKVRTNRLFNKLSSSENYHYLSGLLIGTELKDIGHETYNTITLVSDEKFLPLYSQALNILGIDKNIHLISADKALVKGQSMIYKLYQ